MSAADERDFRIEELFFSTTDLHGKVVSGNEVFTRVSGYSPQELLGKPHSIIRHPDMPRVVFRLLWDRIQAGKSIAAYVKNRAKDGRYYWVLAFVSAFPNGYLSVRFKPSGQFLPTVEKLYAKLRQVELDVELQQGMTKDKAIARSAEVLLEQLNALGFADYDSFIETAFFGDFCSRRSELAARKPQSVGALKFSKVTALLGDISAQLEVILNRQEHFLALEKNIAATTDFISALSLGVQRASFNITIKSEQSSVTGGALSVISEWLRERSQQVGEQLRLVTMPINAELEKVRSGLFHLSTSQLQIEMIQYFLDEMARCDEASRGYTADEAVQTMALLSRSAEQTFAGSLAQLKCLATAIRKVSQSFSDLQREILGLGLAHVNGRVECVRMPDAASLEIILQEVMHSISEAKARILTLEQSFTAMDTLMTGFSSSADLLVGTYSNLCAACSELTQGPQ